MQGGLRKVVIDDEICKKRRRGRILETSRKIRWWFLTNRHFGT
jgi:hypothetical protein